MENNYSKNRTFFDLIMQPISAMGPRANYGHSERKLVHSISTQKAWNVNGNDGIVSDGLFPAFTLL